MDTREEVWAAAMLAERQGDAAAYGRLLGEIAEVLRRVVRGRLVRLGIGAHETEDLVQEMLIGLHLKRHTWEADRPFLPWLHAIVRYKLADAARRFRREARHRHEATPEEWENLFAAPEADFDRALVDLDRHLAELSDGQRTVVEALAVDGATVRETAARLGTSEGAIRVTLHRALKRLAAIAVLDRAKTKGDEP